MTRHFIRLQAHPTPEAALDAAGGVPRLHSHQGGEIVGSVELEGERAMAALLAYAHDLERRALDLRLRAEGMR